MRKTAHFRVLLHGYYFYKLGKIVKIIIQIIQKRKIYAFAKQKNLQNSFRIFMFSQLSQTNTGFCILERCMVNDLTFCFSTHPSFSPSSQLDRQLSPIGDDQ